MTRQSIDGAVLVAGAGAAGIATAISAARGGTQVLLLERSGTIGGTVTRTLLHTLAGFFDSRGSLINFGLAAELVERLLSRGAKPRQIGKVLTLSVAPEVYGEVVEQWLAEESRIKVVRYANMQAITVVDGKVLDVIANTPNGRIDGAPQAVVDATGSGAILRMIDPMLMEDESLAGAGGLVTRLRGADIGTACFPGSLRVNRAISRAVAEGRLPRQSANAWLDQGVHDDEIYIKQLVPMPPRCQIAADCLTGVSPDALAEQKRLTDFLKTLAGFGGARIDRVGEIGLRDGGRVVGEYRLTVDDVRRGRKFSDAVCRGCWPIEHWTAHGGVSIEYLPEGQCYEIPMQSLTPRNMVNVWVAGKCLSADGLAQASARVVGLCWAMGEAVGKVAAREPL